LSREANSLENYHNFVVERTEISLKILTQLPRSELIKKKPESHERFCLSQLIAVIERSSFHVANLPKMSLEAQNGKSSQIAQ
jgi:hypothetical protein